MGLRRKTVYWWRGSVDSHTKDGTSVARGTKVGNNLYKMKIAICEPNTKPPKNTTVTPQTFLAAEPAQSWEIWHK